MAYTSRMRKAKQNAFLAAYRECGNISESARIAEINRGLHYEWLRSFPDYAAAFDDATEEATERLELEARRRAAEGWLEPVYQKGELVGEIRRYSDTLMITLLKALKPDKYRERVSTEHSGPNGGAISIRQDYSELSEAELDALIAERLREIAVLDTLSDRRETGSTAGQLESGDRGSDREA